MNVDYDVISSRCKEKMIALVKEKIKLDEGWHTQGGHCHVVYEEEVFDSMTNETVLRTTGCWSQSMVKEE